MTLLAPFRGRLRGRRPLRPATLVAAMIAIASGIAAGWSQAAPIWRVVHNPTIGFGYPGPPPPVSSDQFRRFLSLYAQFLQSSSEGTVVHFALWLRMAGVWDDDELRSMLALYHWMEQFRRSA